ncbi:Fur family transcriptional regulator [Adhaeribacter aquaticus]|uniref:Fur family transcriptional regulator n=1 Tax=Adhaeribacter aquaticus TaxID=299567 RepID=UPI0004031811|nr:transcriptional repressor [Adhaeribacter aquaticus]
MQQNILSRQELRNQLITVGLKATQQRIVILEALEALHPHHPSAEAVHQKLQSENPGISLGTVYKTLDSFVEVNLAKRVLSEGSRRYDLTDKAHGHIYCTNTKEIIDFSDPDLEKLMETYFQQKNFQNFKVSTISVQITGSKTNPNDSVIIS